MESKVNIKNRKGEKIVVLLRLNPNQKGLAFVMHGLGGFKEQDHLQPMSKAFEKRGYSVVLFDTTNSIGEGGGKYENATITTYYEDLEDVIKWSEGQEWYQKPFALVGHSLGGICTALYAEKFPSKVLALAPISTVVSGKLSVEANEKNDPKRFKDWKRTGWEERESASKPGVIKRLPWSHIIDRLKYDLLLEVNKLTMPVLLITGENDKGTPPEHMEILYKALPGPKEFHVIKEAPHTFRSKEDLGKVGEIFDKWVENL